MKSTVPWLLCGGASGAVVAIVAVALQHRSPDQSEDAMAAAPPRGVEPQTWEPAATNRPGPRSARPDASDTSRGEARHPGTVDDAASAPPASVGAPASAWAAVPGEPEPDDRTPAGTRSGADRPDDRPRRPEASSPPADDLAARARRVEDQANRELERLIPLLDLTPEQQDRVFGILVRHSPDYLPSMLAVTEDGSPLSEPIDAGHDSDGAPAAGPPERTDPPATAEGDTAASAEVAAAGPSDTATPTTDLVAAADAAVGDRKAGQVAGRRAKSRQDELLEVLTLEQGVELLGSDAARSEWWQGVIDYMEAQISDVPLPGAPSDGGGGAAPAPDYGGN